MTLFERLEADLAEARRRSDERALAALGLLKSEVVNVSKEAGFKGSIDDALVIGAARREIKRREESAEAFATAGRTGAADRERAAARVLESYLPTQLTDEQLEAELRGIVDDLKPGGPNAFGMVMKEASQRLAGRAEGSRIAGVARRLLG